MVNPKDLPDIVKFKGIRWLVNRKERDDYSIVEHKGLLAKKMFYVLDPQRNSSEIEELIKENGDVVLQNQITKDMFKKGVKFIALGTLYEILEVTFSQK
jgi:hypothetical protein